MPESHESFLQVEEVLGRLAAFDKHVIHIDLHIVANLVFECLVDEPLIGCPGILQPEGHDPIAIQPPISDKCYLFLIVRCHCDLVISEESIHEV